MASSKLKSVPRVSLVAILRSVETQGNASDLVRFFWDSLVNYWYVHFGKIHSCLKMQMILNKSNIEDPWYFKWPFVRVPLEDVAITGQLREQAGVKLVNAHSTILTHPARSIFVPFFFPGQVNFSSSFPSQIKFFLLFSRPSKFFSSFFPAR